MIRKYKRDREMAKLLATGASIQEAAEAFDVNDYVVERSLRDDAFIERLQRESLAIITETRGKLIETARKAAVTLQNIINDKKATPSARVAAAKAAMEYALKLGESTENSRRISSIEKAISDLQQHLTLNRKP